MITHDWRFQNHWKGVMEMFSVLGVQGGMRGIWERMYKRTLTIEILKIYLQQFQCLRNGYKVPPPGFDVHHNDDPVLINVNQLWAHLQGKTSHHMQAQATTWRGSNQPTLLSFFPTLNHNTSRKIPHNLVKKTFDEHRHIVNCNHVSL
jgi:hypothetical protein